MEYKRLIINPDADVDYHIIKRIARNGGHCPCVAERTDDTICPCKDMRENNTCHCSLFIERKPNEVVG